MRRSIWIKRGRKFQIPVNLPVEMIEKIQEMAIKTYTALCCEGMARVDFFFKGKWGGLRQ